ncbi:MAG: hypothetical protein WC874_01715 [Candidatus Izemoplasmatales bacterium]|jgi:aldose 1-epimerase
MVISQKQITDKITAVRIQFAQGSSIEFLNIGAAISRWTLADNTNIVAGYQNYNDYLTDGMYLGATVGLTAGRIAKGRCVIDGNAYQFASKNANFLHGGDHGLSFVPFILDSIAENQEAAIVTYTTNYHHDWLPGVVTIKVRYTVSPNNLGVELIAKSTATTLCNLTNHSYFNLDGDFTHDLRNHCMQINASNVLLVDDEIIGSKLLSVRQTLFDFTISKPVMPVIVDPILKNQKTFGIDHWFMFALNQSEPNLILYSTKSNRSLTIKTSYPGVTIYTTNYPSEKHLQNGKAAALHSAIAIEPQYASNGINDCRFHDLILRPSEVYHHFIHYQIS